jgi:hypothetical protein
MKSLSTVVIMTIAVLAIAGLISGCGEVSNVPSLNTKGSITKAEATAYANAVNLGVADVPRQMDNVTLKSEKDPTGKHVCDLEEGARYHHLVRVSSPTFRSQTLETGLQLEEVSSSVDVFPTVALADRKFTQQEAEERTARACIGQYYARRFGEGGSHLHVSSPPTTSILSEPIPHSFGLRVAFDFTRAAKGTWSASRVYSDQVAFIVGPVEIELFALTFGRPLPATTEQRLLTLLYSRAKSS